jgi:hypothetical protein
MPIDPLDSTNLTKNFPDAALLDIARNGSAQKDYRLLAVEILQARKSEKLKHPDIQHLVQDLEIELEGIVFEHPAPGTGALKAGVTTRTLYGTPEQQFTGFDDVDVLDEPKLSTPEVLPSDVPPTEPAPVPTEPKPKKPRKPKDDQPDATQ